jgi:hypothetical protein
MRFAVIPSLPEAGRRSEVRFSIARFLCDESLFDQNARKRGIPHSADSVRNDGAVLFRNLPGSGYSPRAALRVTGHESRITDS